MIGTNWMKGLALAGAVAAAMPLTSNATTHYTGKTPASIAMMTAAGVTPLKTVASKHKLKHHTVVKKTTVHHKHKHLTVTSKKKHTA